MKRSSWRGWTCSVITPPGTLRQLNRTSCPSLSSATAVNSIHSPVAGLKKGRKPVIAASARRARRRCQSFRRPGCWLARLSARLGTDSTKRRTAPVVMPGRCDWG